MGTEHIGDRDAGPSSKVAVLLSCHGTVERVEDIAAFINNIRRGRAAPEAVVREVTERFERIGGSPLMRITHEQAVALENRLGVPVRAAGRLWDPYPKDVLAKLCAEHDTIDTIVSLPLAPQSTHIYNAVVERDAAAAGLKVIAAPSWGTRAELVSAFVQAIDEAWARFASSDRPAVLLTAHSLPTAVIASGDPYERDFRAMADAVASRLRAGHADAGMTIEVAFQSQGMGGGEWLGPDLESAFGSLRTEHDQLLLAPIGFLSEHVETLYDIDIEAAALAKKLGFTRLERMPAMNTRPRFIDALEVVARSLLASAVN